MRDGMMPECLQPFDFVMSERAANVLYMIPAIVSVAFVVFTLGFVALHLIRYDGFRSADWWEFGAELNALIWFLVFIPRPFPAVAFGFLFAVPVVAVMWVVPAICHSSAAPDWVPYVTGRGWLYAFELLGGSVFILICGVYVSVFGRICYAI